MRLGDQVRSVVSGFEGIAVGHARWLFGCERVLVQPPVDADGKDQDAIWMDVGELRVMQPQAVTGPNNVAIDTSHGEVETRVTAVGGMSDPPSAKRTP